MDNTPFTLPNCWVLFCQKHLQAPRNKTLTAFSKAISQGDSALASLEGGSLECERQGPFSTVFVAHLQNVNC